MAELNGLRFFLSFALNYVVYSSISMDYTLENIEFKGADSHARGLTLCLLVAL